MNILQIHRTRKKVRILYPDGSSEEADISHLSLAERERFILCMREHRIVSLEEYQKRKAYEGGLP